MARTLDEIYSQAEEIFSLNPKAYSEEEYFRLENEREHKGSFIPGVCYNIFGIEAGYSRHFQSCAQNLLVYPKCGRSVPLINCLYVRDEDPWDSYSIKNNENILHVFAFVHREELYRIKYDSSLDRKFECGNSLSPSHLNVIPYVDITWIDKDGGHSEKVWSFLDEAALLVSEENKKRRENLPDNSKEVFLPCGTLMGYNLPEEIKQVIRNYAQRE